MAPERTDLLRTGGIAGAAAFVVGLVLTTIVERGLTDPDTGLFRMENVRGSTDPGVTTSETLTYGNVTEFAEQAPEGVAIAEPSNVQLAGWVYHRAHLASVEGSYELWIDSSIVEEWMVADLGFAVEPSTLGYLVPLLVVGAAGYWVSQQFDPADPRTAATYGAYVAAGYAVLAGASLFGLAWETGGTGVLDSDFLEGQMRIALSAEPDRFTAVALTGVAYPVVVGGLGAYLGHEFGSDDSPADAPGAE